ncbi:hypothetical protein RhiirB3_216823 [Rhizophagus irregularis]|nr:hypothetical protein RhiirB3_216823 [Rhizophagus irregularis]
MLFIIYTVYIFFNNNLDQEMQKTQHKYISREYDLSLDIEFLIKNDGSLIDRAIRLSPKRSKS